MQLFNSKVQTILFFFFSLKVEGIFYVNKLLEKLMFDELKYWLELKVQYFKDLKLYLLHLSYSFYTIKLKCPSGIGGFLPGIRQIANVAAVPGIVGVKMITTFSC